MYQLPKSELRRLHGRAYRAQQNGHREVCGCLVANSKRLLELHFFKNLSNDPYHFELDQAAIRMLRRTMKRGKKRLAGTFHSHPVSEAVPGKGDLREASANRLMLIYDVCGREPRLWRILGTGRARRTREVELHLI